MNAVRRLIGLFQDSPTFGRDRANLISGITIGTTALALNGVILALILPLLLDPNDRDFRQLTENMEFGQLLGLILLGGTTAFATFLIPIRLASVFMAPRLGRYFDQIVLSGITPLRFLIGKATSQNLFLALILFLLLPWFVLVLSLGGLEGPVFLANLFLVWLYCMMLALLMLWLSLYLNEVLAMLVLIGGAAVVCGLGIAPLPFQPFVVTPFPALMHSVYTAVNVLDILPTQSFSSVFMSCAGGMSIVIVMSLAAIYLGPLYGIIRDNSTFGEVVRTGDSKRRRRFRFRLHIQRPSEIAFFYDNRGDVFRRHEGLVRWGTSFSCLLLVTAAAWSSIFFLFSQMIPAILTIYNWQWWPIQCHAMCQTLHGFLVLGAVFLFSHAKNTTWQRLPLVFGWKTKVSALDTAGFGLFLVISTASAIAVPLLIDQLVALPLGTTVFPLQKYGVEGVPMDFAQLSIEATLAISLAGLTVYFLQRTLCLALWLKSAAISAVSILYLAFVCTLPFMTGVMILEIPALRSSEFLSSIAPSLIVISPFGFFMCLYREVPSAFPAHVSTAPFYVVHGIIIATCLAWMRLLSRKLRLQYAMPLAKEKP